MPNTLSVRSRFRWRTLDDEVYLADGSEVDFSAARRLFILIHGYNTSQEDAQRAFGKFRRRVGGSLPRRELWDFHWPDDHPKALLSKLSYPVRVPQAQSTGNRLAVFLARLPNTVSVTLIAHQLAFTSNFAQTFARLLRPEMTSADRTRPSLRLLMSSDRATHGA